ncbi:MAG: cysteine desulfurase family protein [Bacteroidota bacterium]
MKVFLDNAATTPLNQEVIDVMLEVMKTKFGNPSSIHSYGREVRSLIETSRKTVANLLNVSPSEIFFTSSGTEANNMAIYCTVRDLGIKHVISSRIEHHAVTHTLEELEERGLIKLSYVNIDAQGHVNLEHLQELLANNERSLVSLMHANNEIGTLLPIKKVSEICSKYNAIFHSDTVQSMGHYVHDLKNLNVHFVNCSAHKFHGPKGIGFIYINSNIKIHPFIFGGSQERNMRGGTENIYGIVGLAKALEIACKNLDMDMEYIKGLKSYMIAQLKEAIPRIRFNGDYENGLYTVLNVSFPPSEIGEMLLFNLDIEGIAASGGSACSSGSNIGSHVLAGINADPNRSNVRFSFSRYNTKEEIDYTISILKQLFPVSKV